MATEENDAAGRRTYLALAVKVAVIVVFPPFIALAVWFNAIGIADRTAALPGIKKEGGATLESSRFSTFWPSSVW